MALAVQPAFVRLLAFSAVQSLHVLGGVRRMAHSLLNSAWHFASGGGGPGGVGPGGGIGWPLQYAAVSFAVQPALVRLTRFADMQTLQTLAGFRRIPQSESISRSHEDRPGGSGSGSGPGAGAGSQ